MRKIKLLQNPPKLFLALEKKLRILGRLDKKKPHSGISQFQSDSKYHLVLAFIFLEKILRYFSSFIAPKINLQIRFQRAEIHKTTCKSWEISYESFTNPISSRE